MFFYDSLIGNLIATSVTLITVFILFWKWKFQYWEKKKVPYLEPRFPFGNLETALRGKEHMTLALKRVYDTMKTKGWKHGGVYIYNKPAYFALDLDYIRNILTKDFQHFVDRDLYHNENDRLQAHLVNLKGAKWKDLRAKLTPAFSSGKIKLMFQVMAESQHSLYKRMEDECVKNGPIDVKEILACYSTNVIGSCAFGLDCQALEDENSEFRLLGKKMFTVTIFDTTKRYFAMTFPNLAKYLNIRLVRKEVADAVVSLVQSTIDYREKNNYKRNDFLQLLMNMKDDLTEDEMVSQCTVFFSAGFESSSTLMTYVLYELSKHKDIQDKVRKEIHSVLKKYDNKTTYDAIQEMKYLTQVINETLRLHPPCAALNRKCIKDYKIPGEDVVLEKGTLVFISVLGIHFDKDIFPNPEKFDPDRFSDENKGKRHNYAHMPFGEGPRNCIGMRFGLLQSKIGLALLLNNYKFSVNERTKEPLVYKPNSPILSTKDTIWLNAQKL